MGSPSDVLARENARTLTLDGLTARYAWFADDGLWVGVVEGVPDRISFHAREEGDLPAMFRQAVAHWRADGGGA